METPSSAEVRLEDPLTSTSRRARTGLLAFSALGWVIAETGLVPKRISGLDIEFAAENRAFLVLIVLVVIMYFWMSFSIYAYADFSKRQLALRKSLLREKAIANRDNLFRDFDANGDHGVSSPVDMDLRQAAASAQLAKALQAAMQQAMRPYWTMATPLGWARGALEFFIPLAFGAYIVFLLALLFRAI